LNTHEAPENHEEDPEEEGKKGRKTVKVSVDETKCCGAGQCVLIAPEVFDQRDDDGIVALLDPEPAEELAATVREAAAVCPAAAITFHDGA
jgi:ferredoxin